jgi:hypothetical protein
VEPWTRLSRQLLSVVELWVPEYDFLLFFAPVVSTDYPGGVKLMRLETEEP